MITITADGPTLAALRQANGPAEVRDPEGRVVGLFTPAALNAVQQHGHATPRIDRDELARRKASEKKGRSTREVFEHLRTLTQDPELLADLQEKIDGLKE